MYNVRKIHERAAAIYRDANINFRVDEKTSKALRDYCEAEGLSQSALLRELVGTYLTKVGALKDE